MRTKRLMKFTTFSEFNNGKPRLSSEKAELIEVPVGEPSQLKPITASKSMHGPARWLKPLGRRELADRPDGFGTIASMASLYQAA